MRRTGPRPWEIWYADLNPTEGHEQGEIRPVLVISTEDHADMFGHSVTIVVPITSQHKPQFDNRVHLSWEGGSGWLITEQPRTISVSRLTQPRPRGVVPDQDRQRIREALLDMIDL